MAIRQPLDDQIGGWFFYAQDSVIGGYRRSGYSGRSQRPISSNCSSAELPELWPVSSGSPRACQLLLPAGACVLRSGSWRGPWGRSGRWTWRRAWYPVAYSPPRWPCHPNPFPAGLCALWPDRYSGTADLCGSPADPRGPGSDLSARPRCPGEAVPGDGGAAAGSHCALPRWPGLRTGGSSLTSIAPESFRHDRQMETATPQGWRFSYGQLF